MSEHGSFKSLFEAHPRNKKQKQAMSGNLKKREPSKTIAMILTEEQVGRIEKECSEIDIPRNKYMNLVLDHYWSCRKK